MRLRVEPKDTQDQRPLARGVWLLASGVWKSASARARSGQRFMDPVVRCFGVVRAMVVRYPTPVSPGLDIASARTLVGLGKPVSDAMTARAKQCAIVRAKRPAATDQLDEIKHTEYNKDVERQTRHRD